jgi:putative addiction module CopG family antidote
VARFARSCHPEQNLTYGHQASPDPSINISLPEPLREFVEEQVARGGFGSVSEYVRQLIRHAKDGAEADDKLLQALARSGVRH